MSIASSSSVSYLELLTLDARRDRPGSEGDGVGVDRPPEIGLLRPVEDDHPRAYGELRVENHLGDLEVGHEDLLHEPRQVQAEATDDVEREALVVDHVHAHGQVDDQRAGTHAETEE
jgi:hypothetical protein